MGGLSGGKEGVDARHEGVWIPHQPCRGFQVGFAVGAKKRLGRRIDVEEAAKAIIHVEHLTVLVLEQESALQVTDHRFEPRRCFQKFPFSPLTLGNVSGNATHAGRAPMIVVLQPNPMA